MRFVANGPLVPDELLVARDNGDVIFFCGAGVSQQEAHLPSFVELGGKVIEELGAAIKSPARTLFSRAKDTKHHIPGVGGLVVADRIFSLLEREFETNDVRAAVAKAIKPVGRPALGAHRDILTLATSRAGVTRLVTTNFDLLFEKCNRTLKVSGPPHLPDPRSDKEFRGVVHLHGRVDKTYTRPEDDEFVVSGADFGRAYLSDGWATRFIQALLARYQVVFIGYAADDPPVQYLLEALNLRAGAPARMYAFQGDSGDRGLRRPSGKVVASARSPLMIVRGFRPFGILSQAGLNARGTSMAGTIRCLRARRLARKPSTHTAGVASPI